MTQIVRFCAVTNNPCGTDTIHNDQPGCACENCRRWCREELVRRWQTADTLRTQLTETRASLKALRELPDSWPACADRDAQDDYDAAPHDEERCPKCISEAQYRRRCADVLAQVDAALGERGRK